MGENCKILQQYKEIFSDAKDNILLQWVSYEVPANILTLHNIDRNYFIYKYGNGVFDYFMGVISGNVKIGSCPVMEDFLLYLKNREISADELFELCSHFRRSMIDFSYDAKINSKEVFDAISLIFDNNFRGILKYYTDAIFQRLIDARQEALQASQAKEYFLSNISHEIRTPLNAILGFVNLLLDEEIPKKHSEYLNIILNSGENLLSIINDILDFSKLRSGEFNIEPRDFSIHKEITHTLELFVASAKLKSITITSFIDPQIPMELYGDILRIKQVLSNYLSNAIKFTPQYGHIDVTVNLKNKHLKIGVQDSGKGISKEDQKNIFTAFTQVQDEKDKQSEGTGLGLSISMQLAQLMDGEVGVESEPGKGSYFWMEIPISIASEQYLDFDVVEKLKRYQVAVYTKNYELNYKHKSFIDYAKVFGIDVAVVNSLNQPFDICLFLHEEMSNEELQQVFQSERKYIAMLSQECTVYDNYPHIQTICFPLYCEKLSSVFSELLFSQSFQEPKKNIVKKFNGNILVAEDNEANQELIKIVLNKYGLGFTIVENGEDAVELYKQDNFDLVLMDEQMPKMDGTQALQLIRVYEQKNSLEHTPVAALTANVIKGVKEEGLSHGYDAFLGKPLKLNELEHLFETYLNEHTKKETFHVEKKGHRVMIEGLDAARLTKELMLTIDELVMLLELFVKKMESVMPELNSAIEENDYAVIAKKAHNIKGSSGNFRIEFLQKTASEMEQAAKKKDSEYNYLATYEQMKESIEAIKIS